MINKFNTNIEIKHNGCDSAIFDINRLIKKSPITVNQDKSDSNILIFYSCTFTKERNDEFIREIKVALNNPNCEKIFITGCYLDEEISNPRVLYCRKEELPALLANYSTNNEDIQISNAKYLNQKFKDYVPISISEGCSGNCSYCSIRLVRGKHVSRPVNKIIQDIKYFYNNYSKKIKLVGQDIAEYGKDTNTTFPILIHTLLEKYPDIELQLGSLNPRLLKSFDNKQFEIFNSKNVHGNLHIPVESGSDDVLKNMRRGYNYRDWEKIVLKLSSIGIENISTDIICGFPGESQSDHKKNLKVLTDFNLKFCQIFKFDERPGIDIKLEPRIPENVQVSRTIEAIATFTASYFKNNNSIVNDIVQFGKTVPYNTNLNLEEILK